MKIHMNLQEQSYDILVQRGILKSAGEHLNLARRVLVVTDSGVPAEYARMLAQQCKDRLAAMKKHQQEQEQSRMASRWRFNGLCQHCGGELKGLLVKKCVSCGRPKDY